MSLFFYVFQLNCIALAIAGCSDSSSGSASDSSPIQVVVKATSGPQLALVTPTSVAIAWRTGGLTVGSVEYGRDSAELDMKEEESVAAREHVLHLDELQPGTRYHYRILAGERILGDGREFSTAPVDPNAPVVFAVWGDSGVASVAQFEVADQVLVEDPDLVLLTGDVLYGSDIERLYFEPYRNLLDHMPFYPSLGNHDVAIAAGRVLLNALYLPSNTADGSERFYSFDFGGVHFVALDSNQRLTPGSVQLRWVEDDLEKTVARWRVVYFHHPLYSSSAHGSHLALRQNLGALLEAHGVDLVLTGHDHDYERTFPMRDEAVVNTDQEPHYQDPRGTIYIVTGGGGNVLYGNGRSFFTAYSVSSHHFCLVEVAGARLTLKAVRSDGHVMDRVSVTKTVRR